MPTQGSTGGSHRERKRLATIARIRERALELFEEQGYAATTVDQISSAAMVAPRTFFRYFPTKASVSVSLQSEWLEIFNEHAPLRPTESALDGIRRILLEIVRHIEADPEPVVRATRVNRLSNELLLASLQWELQWRTQLAELVAERYAHPDDASTFGGVTMAVVTGNLTYWALDDARGSLADLMMRGLDQLEHGFDIGRP